MGLLTGQAGSQQRSQQRSQSHTISCSAAAGRGRSGICHPEQNHLTALEFSPENMEAVSEGRTLSLVLINSV